eukprot:3767627-Amphidinium_carterae.1
MVAQVVAAKDSTSYMSWKGSMLVRANELERNTLHGIGAMLPHTNVCHGNGDHMMMKPDQRSS